MRTPEVSFWDLLNSGYYIALGTMLREELQRATGDNEHDSWKQVMLDSLNFSNLKKMIEDRLPEREEVKMLQGLIGICILENSETILDGRELSAIGGNGILEYMDMLKKYCIQWEWLWGLVGHLQMQLKTQQIKKNLVENTNVEENLVLWVSSQVDSEQYGVAECYDRMWDELINAVIRRRESDTEEHLRLLDWMRVKEENMEK